jgi:hypothetical protein
VLKAQSHGPACAPTPSEPFTGTKRKFLLSALEYSDGLHLVAWPWHHTLQRQFQRKEDLKRSSLNENKQPSSQQHIRHHHTPVPIARYRNAVVVISRRGLLRRFRTPPRRHRPGQYIYTCVASSTPRRREPRHRGGDRGGRAFCLYPRTVGVCKLSCCGAKSNPSRCVVPSALSRCPMRLRKGFGSRDAAGFWFDETVFWIWRRWSF